MIVTSPKRSRHVPSGVGDWFSYYAGYSSQFVHEVLDSIALPATARVLDPWNGSGTTTRIACKLGYASFGFDLNPVMVIVAKANLLPLSIKSSLASLCREIIRGTLDQKKTSTDLYEPLEIWLKPDSAHFLRRIEQSIRRLLIDNQTLDLYKSNNIAHVSSLAAFFYVALFRTIRELVQLFCGSNPTWIRQPASFEDRLSLDSGQICITFKRHVQSMINAIPDIAQHEKRSHTLTPECRVELASSESLPILDHTIDAVITSPPYCTRIDYCVATKPELAILGYQMGTDFKSLRDRMIGTPTIAGKNIATQILWGNTCCEFLNTIEGHTSKASKSYYLKTFLQYYDSLFRSLTEIDRVMKATGIVTLVVQDSYYKNVHNNLPKIVSEMGNSLGWTLHSQSDFAMKSSMASINTRRGVHRSESSAVESVVTFSQNNNIGQTMPPTPLMNGSDLISAVDNRMAQVHTRTLDVSFNELLDMHNEGELIIQPEYQRLARWSEGQRSRLIESLILELPLPPIFVIEQADGAYELFDGLQRISSYLHFRGKLKDPDNLEELLNPLTLTDCDIVKELNGHTYATLPKALEIRLKRNFVRMEVIRRESDQRLKYYMFKRLNTGGSMLSQQEIRNCTIRLLSNHFNQFLKRLNEYGPFLNCIANISEEQEKQKFGEELALRFFAFKNYRNAYIHDVADFMTDYMEAVSDPDATAITFDYEQEEHVFNKTFTILNAALGDKIFSAKNAKGNYVSRFLSYHYEAFALGIQPYLDNIDPDNNDTIVIIKNAFDEIKASQDFKSLTTGGGKNYKRPLDERIGYVERALAECL